MNDRNTPSTDPLEGLLDQFDVGTPFADEVERLLNERGGPVPVDEAEVTRAVASIRSRLDAPREAAPAPLPVPAPTNTSTWWGAGVAVAAAALVAVGMWASSGTQAIDPAVQGPAVVHTTTPDTSSVELRPGSLFSYRHDTVLLTEGAVSIDHQGGEDTVHRVRLANLDVVVEPVGTIYYAGSRGEVAAVWVEEGRIRLVHDAQGHLGEVDAAGWAILVRHPDREGIEVHRIADGPFDAEELDLEHTGVAQLMADMRWMALPSAARAHIMGGVAE